MRKSGAEEERFELPVPLRVRRFSNFHSPPGSAKAYPQVPDATSANLAPRGTERHRDQAGDQARDQGAPAGPRVEALAHAVLEAVAEGRAESLVLAGELAESILGQDDVQRAAMLRRLVQERSPFALVRAIELAELLLRGRAASQRCGG